MWQPEETPRLYRKRGRRGGFETVHHDTRYAFIDAFAIENIVCDGAVSTIRRKGRRLL